MNLNAKYANSFVSEHLCHHSHVKNGNKWSALTFSVCLSASHTVLEPSWSTVEVPAWWQTGLFSLTADKAAYKSGKIWTHMDGAKNGSAENSWENIRRWHERRAYNLHITLYRLSLVYWSMTQSTTDQSAIFERLSLKFRSHLWWFTAGYITLTPLLSYLF